MREVTEGAGAYLREGTSLTTAVRRRWRSPAGSLDEFLFAVCIDVAMPLEHDKTRVTPGCRCPPSWSGDRMTELKMIDAVRTFHARGIAKRFRRAAFSARGETMRLLNDHAPVKRQGRRPRTGARA